MALTFDYANRIVLSDASITDLVLFHETLRDVEASSMGILYPRIHDYRAIDIGGGAIFPSITFVNGWTLQFPTGNFSISGGNLSATINPVPGCYINQRDSAAYAVTASGGGSLAQSDIAAIAAAVWGYKR